MQIISFSSAVLRITNVFLQKYVIFLGLKYIMMCLIIIIRSENVISNPLRTYSDRLIIFYIDPPNRLSLASMLHSCLIACQHFH